MQKFAWLLIAACSACSPVAPRVPFSRPVAMHPDLRAGSRIFYNDRIAELLTSRGVKPALDSQSPEPDSRRAFERNVFTYAYYGLKAREEVRDIPGIEPTFQAAVAMLVVRALTSNRDSQPFELDRYSGDLLPQVFNRAREAAVIVAKRLADSPPPSAGGTLDERLARLGPEWSPTALLGHGYFSYSTPEAYQYGVSKFRPITPYTDRSTGAVTKSYSLLIEIEITELNAFNFLLRAAVDPRPGRSFQDADRELFGCQQSIYVVAAEILTALNRRADIVPPPWQRGRPERPARPGRKVSDPPLPGGRSVEAYRRQIIRLLAGRKVPPLPDEERNDLGELLFRLAYIYGNSHQRALPAAVSYTDERVATAIVYETLRGTADPAAVVRAAIEPTIPKAREVLTQVLLGAPAKATVEELVASTRAVIESRGITLETRKLPHAVAGLSHGGRISLTPGLSENPRWELQVLLHELGHEIFEHWREPNEPLAIRQLQAEALSFLVLQGLGVETLSSSTSPSARLKLAASYLRDSENRVDRLVAKMLKAID